jgi:hypothetical protein
MREIPTCAGLYAILSTPENRRDRLQAVSPNFSPCRDDSVSFAGRRAAIRSSFLVPRPIEETTAVLRHADPVAGLFHAAKGCSFLSEYGCRSSVLDGATVIAFPISSTHTINFRP